MHFHHYHHHLMTLMHFLQWLMQAATEKEKVLAELIVKLTKLNGPSITSSKSGSNSPLGLSSMFVCPICLNSQKSPKSHSEHLHNECKEGKAGRSSCAFNLAVPEHSSATSLLVHLCWKP